VNKTVDDLLKSTLSGLGIDPEKKKQILSGVEPGKAEPKPPAPEKKESPPARADIFEIKPPEKPPKVDSLSWLKEPAAKPEPAVKKPEAPIFKAEPSAKKAEPKTTREEKEIFPDFGKKEGVFGESYVESKKKKSKPVVPIIGGLLVVAAGAVIFVVLGGKKEPAPDARQAVTNVQREVKPLDAAPETSAPQDAASGETVPPAATPLPQVKEKATSPAKPAAEKPSPAVDKRPSSESSSASDAAGAPLVPVDQPAVKVQEIKPTRTQPAVGDAGGGQSAPAKPKTTLGELVPLTEVDTVPVLVKRIEPDYPPLAFKMKAEGSVTVNALIDETGAVVRTEVLKTSGSPYGFEKASRDAVMKWRYRPAVKDSTYVKVWMPVVVTFTMQK
jgi:protein TonB